VGEVAQYEDMYRLCYIRGPEGIIVALVERIGADRAAGRGHPILAADAPTPPPAPGVARR
jgi:hypothetical protein